MRGEVKPSGEFLYTRNSSGKTRFGGKKNKKIKTHKKTKRRKTVTKYF
jgi:hypothetical protein